MAFYGLLWLILLFFSKYIKYVNQKIEIKSVQSSLLSSPLFLAINSEKSNEKGEEEIYNFEELKEFKSNKSVD